MPIRDVEANLNNYVPLDGAKFRSTDTHKVWIGDGNSWNLDPTSGPSPTLDGADLGDSAVTSLDFVPQDLTSTAGTSGQVAYHDGTDGNNANIKEPAHHDGADWTGLESGSVIA
jgi:hypothetical protein